MDNYGHIPTNGWTPPANNPRHETTQFHESSLYISLISGRPTIRVIFCNTNMYGLLFTTALGHEELEVVIGGL